MALTSCVSRPHSLMQSLEHRRDCGISASSTCSADVRRSDRQSDQRPRIGRSPELKIRARRPGGRSACDPSWAKLVRTCSIANAADCLPEVIG
jgi:hypothetical protein